MVGILARVESAAQPISNPTGEWLTNAQQVLSLGLDAARKSAHRARITGVITYVLGDVPRFCVQDSTGGLVVLYTNSDLRPAPWQTVEIESAAGAGLLVPMLVDAAVRITGTAPAPKPVVTTAARLTAGEHFGEWVSLEGVIRDVAWNGRRRILFISSGGLRFHALADPCGDEPLPVSWIDARVEVRGVCWTDVDREGKPLGFTLYMPGTNWVRFLEKRERPVFHEPAIDPGSSSRIRQQSDDRIKIAGVVSFHGPDGTVYMRSGTTALEARPLAPLVRMSPKGRYLDRPPQPSLKPGTQVEVIGAPMAASHAAMLQDAEVRVIGTTSPPMARLANARDLLSGERDRELVELDARVLARAANGNLVLQASGTSFEGIPAHESIIPADLKQDDLVRIAGICVVPNNALPLARSFRLLVRDASDLQISGHWSAWRSTEAARAGGIVVALGIGALTVIWILRRQVAERTAALALSNHSLRLEVEQRERAQTDLARALEAEKELSRLRSRFVSMVSHEFRTPLGIIMSASDILRKYSDRLPPERRVEHLQEIANAARLMGGLMEQVLVLGRVESGRISYHSNALDLAALSRKIADEQIAASGGRCSLAFSCVNINEPAQGDEGLLRHILANLLSNAVKYSPDSCAVELTVARAGTEAVFTIRDHGIGIPAADRAHLFTAFHRGSNVGEAPGTGLGLLIVQRCVELHGGRIRFETEEGSGTTFTVTLPLFAGPPETPKRQPDLSPQPRS